MSFRRVLLNTCQEEFEGAAAAREVCTWQTAPPHKSMFCLKSCYVQHVMSACITHRQCMQSRTAVYHVLSHGHLVCDDIVSTFLQHPMTCHIVMLLRCSGHVV